MFTVFTFILAVISLGWVINIYNKESNREELEEDLFSNSPILPHDAESLFS